MSCQQSNPSLTERVTSSPDYDSLIEDWVAGEHASIQRVWDSQAEKVDFLDTIEYQAMKTIDGFDEEQIKGYREALTKRLADPSSGIRLHAVGRLVSFSAVDSPESATEFEIVKCLPVYLELLDRSEPVKQYDLPSKNTQAKTLILLASEAGPQVFGDSPPVLSFAKRLGSQGERLVEPVAALLSNPLTVSGAINVLGELGPVAAPTLKQIKEAVENETDPDSKKYLQELADKAIANIGG
jgi:hypothetical protein